MGDVQMSAAAAATVTSRFHDLSAEFTNSVRTVVEVATRLDLGAGEFGPEISSGTSAMDIAWHEAFKVCGTTAAIIAGNTNQMSLDLSRLDREASTAIQL
jgi:hypothetical protein